MYYLKRHWVFRFYNYCVLELRRIQINDNRAFVVTYRGIFIVDTFPACLREGFTAVRVAFIRLLSLSIILSDQSWILLFIVTFGYEHLIANEYSKDDV